MFRVLLFGVGFRVLKFRVIPLGFWGFGSLYTSLEYVATKQSSAIIYNILRRRRRKAEEGELLESNKY